MNPARSVEPEWLDTLPPDDPRAQRSRRDLKRLNRIMGNAGMLRRQLLQHHARPASLVELGAGDGSLMLALVRRLPQPPAHIILIDRQPGIAAASMQALTAMGCTVHCVAADAFDWLAQTDHVDGILCNLFLHHFAPQPLADLLQACAAKTSLFLACEPARTRTALCGSHLLGLIGCNGVTRHDAVVSVRAGFRPGELSALWPDKPTWRLTEQHAGLFSHVFAARRRETSNG